MNHHFRSMRRILSSILTSILQYVFSNENIKIFSWKSYELINLNTFTRTLLFTISNYVHVTKSISVCIIQNETSHQGQKNWNINLLGFIWKYLKQFSVVLFSVSNAVKKKQKKKGRMINFFLRIRISDYLKSNSVLTAYLSNESIPSIDLSLSW